MLEVLRGLDRLTETETEIVLDIAGVLDIADCVYCGCEQVPTSPTDEGPACRPGFGCHASQGFSGYGQSEREKNK
jgi:hypothetical protein